MIKHYPSTKVQRSMTYISCCILLMLSLTSCNPPLTREEEAIQAIELMWRDPYREKSDTGITLDQDGIAKHFKNDVALFLKIARETKNPETRTWTLSTLSACDSPDVIPALGSFLTDKNPPYPFVEATRAKAMAIFELQKYLERSNEDTRKAARPLLSELLEQQLNLDNRIFFLVSCAALAGVEDLGAKVAPLLEKYPMTWGERRNCMFYVKQAKSSSKKQVIADELARAEKYAESLREKS